METLTKIFLKIYFLKAEVCCGWLEESKGISKSVFLTVSTYIMKMFPPHQLGV